MGAHQLTVPSKALHLLVVRSSVFDSPLFRGRRQVNLAIPRVGDLRAQRTTACASRSMGPEKVGGLAMRAAVGQTDALSRGDFPTATHGESELDSFASSCHLLRPCPLPASCAGRRWPLDIRLRGSSNDGCLAASFGNLPTADP